MAASLLPPPGGMMIGMDGMQPPPPPGTDMTGICFRDQIWLNAVPLDRNFVFDCFTLSPFYDWTCNNEQLRRCSIHPLDISHLSKMRGIEFVLNEVLEPHVFVFQKQKRDGTEKITPMLMYYVLDGSIYQAPQLCSALTSCMVRALYHISKSFTIASSKLEKISYDTESDNLKADAKPGGESVEFKGVKQVDRILATLQRKIPPAPPPPPFPEGFAAPLSNTDQEQDGQAQDEHIDPISDQGPPAKRLKIER